MNTILKTKKRAVLYLFFIMGLFFFSLVNFPPVEFFPKMDRGNFTLKLDYPDGTSIFKIDKTAKKIEDLLKKEKVVQKFSTNITTGSLNMTVLLVPKEKRDITTSDFINYFRKKLNFLTGIKSLAMTEQGMGRRGKSGKPISIEVSGNDFSVIENLCKKVYNAIKDVKGLVDLDDGVSGGRPELKIKIDRNKIYNLGLSFSEVAGEIRTYVYGKIAGKYRVDNDEFDIRVRLDKKYVSTIKKLENAVLYIRGKKLFLKDIAKIEFSKSYTTIVRKNKKRTLYVEGDFYGRPLGAVIADINERLKKLTFPKGYEYRFGGSESDRRKAFANLGLALIAALFLVYMIMASQFEAFLSPFIIMFTIPLSIIGVVLFLNMFDLAFSVTVIIGIIMLAGVVVNNGILLIEYMNSMRKKGYDLKNAVIEGAKIRMRPIFMTALTTILGMMPLAFGIGSGSDFFQPLAVTVAGGLLFSTVLTLTFIPVLYYLKESIFSGKNA